MKKLIYITLATAILTGTISCQKDDDFYEEDNIITEETTSTTTTTASSSGTENGSTSTETETTVETTTNGEVETTETTSTTTTTTTEVTPVRENTFTLASEGTFEVNPFYVHHIYKNNFYEIYFHGITWGTSIGGSIKFNKNAASGIYNVNPRGSIYGSYLLSDEVAIEIGNYNHQNIAQSGTVELIVAEKYTKVIFKNIPTVRSTDQTASDMISGTFTIITSN
jgi:hypothetical protein